MESREGRWKNQGILFVIMLLLLLGAGVEEGRSLFQSLFKTSIVSIPNIIAFLTFAAAILSSEALGWLINHISLSIVTLCRNTPPGAWYSSEWKKQLSKSPVWDWLRNAAKTGNTNSTISKQLEECNEDIILSYYWQQGPVALIGWVSRRHNIYWASWTAIFSFIIALIIFIFIVSFSKMHVHWIATCAITVTAAILCIPFIIHANVARKEADNMLELWFLHKFYGACPEGECFSSRNLLDLLNLAGSEKRSQE